MKNGMMILGIVFVLASGFIIANLLPPAEGQPAPYVEPVAKGADVLTGIIWALLILGAYLLPTFVAGRRKHHNTMSIFVINLFLGWTFLGWVVALAMAFTEVRPVPKRQEPRPPSGEQE